MYLSLDWLSQYVDLGAVTPEDAAHDLTMATAEVEGVEPLIRAVRGVVVGKILAGEPIDTGDPDKPMRYVTVDTGNGMFETVCGAPNVAVGMKSAFAPPGTVLAGGRTVDEQKVYGRMSWGMLCSPLELGWGGSHAGIMAFPADLETGTDLAALVPASDTVIEIDNKSITHRPDLWGHYGFARALAAIYGLELKPLDAADARLWESLPAFPLRIEDEEGCPGYCCLDIAGLVPAYAPIDIQYRLLAIGLRPINLLVDLTNYIMCELGQPMHAFDGTRIRDIVVKPFGSRGTYVTLDDVPRTMEPPDLMITDHTGPIAVAGIMGGRETEIMEDTGRVLLESANFHPARIRRTALRLGLRTDAAMRFEKGQPPYHMLLSIARFVRLLERAGQRPAIKSRLTCAGNTGETPRTMRMELGYIPRAIGMDIPAGRVTGILESLGFGCTVEDGILSLTIPRHRSARDISIPNDIVEEVARIFGYDNIQPAMPEIEMSAYHFNPELDRRWKLVRHLGTAHGFVEVHTYSWYDDNWLARMGYNPCAALTIRNPAAENATRMRRELMPNLLALVEPNAAYRDEFRLFEVGNIFIPSEGGMTQHTHLGGLTCGTARSGKLDRRFLEVKGVVEDVLALTGVEDVLFHESNDTAAPWRAPGAVMDVLADGHIAGSLGYLTNELFPAFEKISQAVWFELNLDELPARTWPELSFKPLPVYPGSWMDFSVLAPADTRFAELEQILAGFSHPILPGSRFLSDYRGKGLPEGMVSYTFRFRLGLAERTLTGEDLASFHEAFLARLGDRGYSVR